MKIINKTKYIILAGNCRIASGIFDRVRGLLGRSSMEKDSALVLKPCNSVHSFFMRFSIDLVFIDKNYRVVKVIRSFKPFRISPVYFKASSVIEFPAGSITPDSVGPGDLISIE